MTSRFRGSFGLRVGLLAMAGLAFACSSSESDTTSGATAGAGAAAAGTGGSGTTTTTSGSTASGSGTAATSGSGGGGGAPSVSCAPLPAPTGTVINVDASQDLSSIASSAAAGSTIVLASGTYAISASVSLAADGMTLRSANNDASSVVIDAGYVVDEAIRITGSNVTVAHLTVTRAVNHPIHVYPPAAGVDVKGTLLYGLRLIDGGEQFVKVNSISGQAGWPDEGRVECSLFQLTDAGRPHVSTAATGCYTGGIDVHAGWKWTVRNNQFEGIWCDTGLAEHAVHFWSGSRDTVVENNRILNCARGIGFGLGGDTNVRMYSDAPDGGAALSHYDGIIRNNVVYGNIAEYDTGIALEDAALPHVLHNTLVNGAGATGFFSSIDYRFADTSALIANNITQTITGRDGATAMLQTNLQNASLDLFVDGAALDFHLAASATGAIDQGTAFPDSGVDIDGQAHNLGAGPDIGADERSP